MSVNNYLKRMLYNGDVFCSDTRIGQVVRMDEYRVANGIVVVTKILNFLVA